MPLTEIRSISPNEVKQLDWKPITKQEGQFRGSQELHELAKKIISVLEDPDSDGIAVLVYDNDYDAYLGRRPLRQAVETLSRQKVQTRKINEVDGNGSRSGSKLYLRFRPTGNSSK